MLWTMGLSIKADIAELVSKRWLMVLSLAVWSAVTLLMGHVQGHNELY